MERINITTTAEVDFNLLRLNLQEAYNQVVFTVKQAFVPEFFRFEPVLIMDTSELEELQESLAVLRANLAVLMCIVPSEEGNIADQTDLEVFDLGDGIGI